MGISMLTISIERDAKRRGCQCWPISIEEDAKRRGYQCRPISIEGDANRRGMSMLANFNRRGCQ